jgi:hypothetical protein
MRQMAKRRFGRPGPADSRLRAKLPAALGLHLPTPRATLGCFNRGHR